jgi:sulfite exporter TauE/SafE
MLQILLGASFGLVSIGIAYYFLRESLVSIAMTIVILLGTVYGMSVLVLLLAYGIAFVPVTIWKWTDRDSRLYNRLLIAQEVWYEFRDARLEYIKQVCICSWLVKEYRTPANSDFMDTLMTELPKNDLDG